jgi:hypothetical protein
MRTLVSRFAVHRQGARRASICSPMSADIGVDAVAPAQHGREQDFALNARPTHFVALPG